MSSDIAAPDPSSADSAGSLANSIRSKPEEAEPLAGSDDELAWDGVQGHGSDLRLEPLKSSSDDLAGMLAAARPDPMLDVVAGEPVKSAISDVPHAIGRPIPTKQEENDDTVAEFSSIKTDAPLVSSTERKGRSNKGRLEKEAEDEDEDDDADDVEVPVGGSSYAMILLASYASAITLGLIWILASGRTLKNAENPPISSAAAQFKSRFDQGVRADCSRTVDELSAIPASHRAVLGKTVKLNDLEVTPLELREGPVELERTLTERTIRKAGDHALKLKILFRNASRSAIFAPLDEGFIRQRLRADPESFVESHAGESMISMYPLAVDSEWSIRGQEFRELRPKESFESLIVSEPNAMGKLVPEMVWRIHLRTGINQISDFGFTFGPADIKPEK